MKRATPKPTESAQDAQRLEAYLRALHDEFPRLRFIDKEQSLLCRLIDRALRLLTFGGQSAFVQRYTTVLGQRIYLPSRWAHFGDRERYLILRHEAVHLRQFRRFGMPLMAFFYLLPFFPVGLALGRALIEREAYRESLVALAEVAGVEALDDPQQIEYIVRQFTGPAYGWMWPFPVQVRAWFRRVREELRAVDIAK